MTDALTLSSFPPSILSEVIAIRDRIRPQITPGMPVIDVDGDEATVIARTSDEAWVDYPHAGPTTVSITDIEPDWDAIESAEDS